MIDATRALAGTGRSGAGLVFFAVLCWCGGCATAPSEPATPPSADVTVDEAWRDAKTVASLAPGRIPVVGTGASMQPVYGDNTMLVITPIDYDQLKVGMVVAYTNHDGVRIVHRLVERVARGWRVMGLNNEQVDAELVTSKNLIGVIYASFNFDDEAPPKK